MNILYESPILESTTRRDGGKYWRIKAYRDQDGSWTQTEYWQTGQEEHQFSTPNRVHGKNTGRSNATTPQEQAVQEAQSEMRKKLDRGYWIQGQAPTTVARPLPMLALKFEDRRHNVVYPAAVQPKLDGHRMLFNGQEGWTRAGKAVIAEVIEHLHFDTGGLIVDGELMLPHDEFGFEATTSAVKKFRPELSPHLIYYVYDVVDETQTFQQRWRRLQELAKTFPAQVQLIETRTVNNEAGVHEAHGAFVEAGFEGAMVRNWASAYRLKDRSSDLLKVKEFQDDEFEIIGVEQGTAKHEGCAIIVLQTKAGKPFRATPKASVAERRRLYEHRASLIGKHGTVIYQNLSPDGIPRFPIFKAVRDD